MPTTINPSTGEPLREHPFFEADDTDSRLVRARETFEMWREYPIAKRAKLIGALATVLRDRRESAAELMADEMGKPLAQGRAEIEKCAWLCEFFASEGEAMLDPDHAETDAIRSYVSYQPLGVILAIMPWNYPWWQALRFAIPALLAGNTALLKHALITTGSALAIERALRDAGFPIGCLETLVIDHDAVAQLIADPRVVGVTLTGSTGAGQAIGEAAGRAIKKLVLELGGSDPYVICRDADLDLAADVCVRARLTNAGQSCIAAKRFIVSDPVADQFCERVVERMKQAVVGSPRDPATTVGPLAREDLRDALHDQVQRSIAAGAIVLLGGERPEGPGAFYPPTVLSGVRPGMAAADEELFGPVAAIIRVQNEDEAIAVANSSRFGLGAAIFSRDIERAEAIARDRLDAGQCFVNAQVRSDPRLPFGGVKQSGHGRELGRAGLLEWVNAKTVWVE